MSTSGLSAAERDDDRENNILAAGGVFAALLQAGLDPEIVYDDGAATNAMTIELHFMKSRYRVTVERVLDDEEASAVVQEVTR